MKSEPTTYLEFQESFGRQTPPETWSNLLKTLWYDAKGEWQNAHELAEALQDDLGNWVHAYLHRKEGDTFNAGYWYRCAGKVFPEIDLEVEHRYIFEAIVHH